MILPFTKRPVAFMSAAKAMGSETGVSVTAGRTPIETFALRAGRLAKADRH